MNMSMSKAKTAISLDAELLKLTDKQAQKTGKSRSGIVEIALKKYFNDIQQQEILLALNETYSDNEEAEELGNLTKEYLTSHLVEDEKW